MAGHQAAQVLLVNLSHSSLTVISVTVLFHAANLYGMQKVNKQQLLLFVNITVRRSLLSAVVTANYL